MIASAPFVLEKAPMGVGVLVGIWALGLVGLWLCFGGTRRVGAVIRRHKRERRVAGAGLVFLAVVLTVFAFTAGVRVTVACDTGRIEIDQYGPAWAGALSFPVAQVREVGVALESPEPEDHRPPQKVLVARLENGEQYVLSNGPWRGYGSNERAAVALTAALAKCGPPPSTSDK